MVEHQLKHLNYNMLCAVSIRTSGPNPLKHDLLQLCICVVDNFIRLSNKMVPFIVDLVPKRPEEIHEELKGCEVSKQKLNDIIINGIDPYIAADRFEEWFKALKLPGLKRIVPLCYNWSRIKPFMLNWLGFETCNQFIADQVRDLLTIAVAANDRSNLRGDPAPYQKPLFHYLCSDHGIRNISKDPPGDCHALIETYRRMLTKNPYLVDGSTKPGSQV